MSGIVAAAQSSGCCCRPQQGCTCSNPNRPGAIIDRGISSVLVSADFGIDEAYRNNGANHCGQCECFSLTGFVYGIYGYNSSSTIEDPECDNRPCQPVGCAGCGTFSVSASFGQRVALQSFPGTQRWQSRVSRLDENQAGLWNYEGRRVGYCFSESQGLRVRRFCPFLYRIPSPDVFASLVVDPGGAWVSTTGEYGSTPYGDTIGRLVAFAACELGWGTFGGPCRYEARVALVYAFEWYVLWKLATDPTWDAWTDLSLPRYSADYIKPCLAPTDTVYGEYVLAGMPEYDFYEEDGDCGPVRYFREVRATVPQRIVVS